MSSLFSFRGRADQHDWLMVEIVSGIAGILVAMLWAYAAYTSEAPLPEKGTSAFTAIWTLFWYADPLMKLLLLGSIGVVFAGIWIWYATMVKRLHDRGKSGLHAIFYYIPVIGPIWQFIECRLLPGTPGTNEYDTSKLTDFNVASYEYDRYVQERNQTSQNNKIEKPVSKLKRNKKPRKPKPLFGG